MRPLHRPFTMTAASPAPDAGRPDRADGTTDPTGPDRDDTGSSRPRWLRVAGGVRRQVAEDQVAMLSAGVAFYAMLALFPALIALTSIYGLAFDPQSIQDQVDTISRIAPRSISTILDRQMTDIVSGSDGALTFGLVLALAVTLWAASTGMQGLVRAVNLASNCTETRSFLHQRLLALLFTLGGFLFVVASIALIAVVPMVLGPLGLERSAETAVSVLRWPVLALLVFAALALVYRYGPNRSNPRWRWVSMGSLVATALWLLGSLAFALYTSRVASFNEVYGSLAAPIVLLVWLFITAFAVLLGAEVNSEIEHLYGEGSPGCRRPPERPLHVTEGD